MGCKDEDCAAAIPQSITTKADTARMLPPRCGKEPPVYTLRPTRLSSVVITITLRCNFCPHVRCCCMACMAAMLPLAVAQSSAAAGGRAPAASARLKSADEAFRAGSAAYLQNDLRLAHAQFAKVVQLAPGVAAGHSAFGTVLLAEGDARSAATQLELAHKTRSAGCGHHRPSCDGLLAAAGLCEIGEDVSASRAG